ncbi:MAG: SPOR domain-containing protein [Burkholderiales bacterium]|nr:SPOR domain-containing protein [Burkholderiales bacterium]
MMGVFATQASAEALASSLRAKTTQNITVLVVKDMDGVPTWVVALGAFASVAEARAQTAPIATALQLRSPPLTMMLPNKP